MFIYTFILYWKVIMKIIKILDDQDITDDK